MSRLLACAVSLGASLAASAQTPWPGPQFNPQPAADDIVLPMPCGGAMTFRRVNVPGAHVLDDRRMQLGSIDPRYAYAENTRTAYVGGGFQDPKQKSQRYYLIGKYEVTQLQFGALGDACPAVDDNGRLPKVSVTWSEAIAFTAKYSGWLVKNAAARLPGDDGSPGFVRLPTEAEWEFAARGGIAVADSVFEQPTYPMPEGLKRHAWFGSSESANHELNAVGLLKPNPLGLHDVIGNAGEFVLDPFQLNKLSRQHGQSGGYLVKGGDYETAAADIRSAYRLEFSPVDKTGERRSSTIGLRVVLVPAALPSTGRLQTVRTLWADLPKTAAGPSAGGAPAADPLKEIELLAATVTDPALKKRIQNLGGVMKANLQSRNEQRDRSARSEVRVAAYLGQKLAQEVANVKRKTEMLATLKSLPDLARETQAGLTRDQEALDANLLYYLDTVKRLGYDYPSAVTAAQADILKREFEGRGVGPLYEKFVQRAVSHADGVRNGKPPDPKTVLAEMR
ncbi:MAG: SUMF1/EgtB/PvdO family nonheme iron enzyme [Caldimonas sp.]